MNLQQITKLTGGPILKSPRDLKTNTTFYFTAGIIVLFAFWKVFRAQNKILNLLNSIKNENTNVKKMTKGKKILK